MDYIPILKLAIVIVLIILGLRWKLPLGVTMLGASIFLGIFLRVNPKNIIMTLLRTLIDGLTLELVGMLLLIMVLERIMEGQGVLQQLVTDIRRVIPNNRLALSLLPALIGFLPSVGGALISCPLVDQGAGDLELAPEVKGYINYWFRHVWEYSIPLYPAVVMTAGMTGMEVVELIPYLFPSTLVAIGTGFVILHVVAGDKFGDRAGQRQVEWKDLVGIGEGLAPVLITLSLVIVFKLAVITSLTLTIVGLLFYYRYDREGLVDIGKHLDLRIVMNVAGIMMFKEMLVASGLSVILPEIMLHLELPPLLIVAALPFLLGALFGLTSAVVGVGFPLLLGILGGIMEPSYIVVAYVSCLAGIMLTPMHVCMVLTLEYFKAGFGRFWRWVFISEAVVVGAAFVMYWVIS